jgi:uncharacterized protein (TIGR03000 family)
MIRPSLKCLLIGAVAAVVLSSVAPQADAQWWGVYRPAAWRWSCGYSPCYSPCYATVSCGSYSDDGCGAYLGWRPGPVRRLLLGRCRWYWGGYWGSCYSGCYSGCATCGGGVSTGATTGQPTVAPTPAKKPVVESPAMPTETPAAPAPLEPTPPAPGGALTPVPQKTTETSAEQSGMLTVWVPYDAKVTVNGLETRSSGSRRQFVSYGLKPGFSYKYVVVAQVVRDGQVQEDSRTVTLTAGQITSVAFGFNTSAPQQVASAN